MKNSYCFLLIWSIFLFSCSESTDVPDSPKEIDNVILEDLDLDRSLSLLPEFYDQLNSDSIYFISQNGERDLFIVTKHDTESVFSPESHNSYKAKLISYSLEPTSATTNYWMSVSASTNYNSNFTEIQEYFRAAVIDYSDIGKGNQFLKVFPSQQDEAHEMINEVSLGERVFQNVYTGQGSTSRNGAYSTFYYSPSIGIVGFTDNNNELWILDTDE